LFLVSIDCSSQIDTIQINQLQVFSNNTFSNVGSVIITGDLTYLENYNPLNTFFYYQNKLFSGVAKTVDSSQITFISFKNGIIHGNWYDEIIWNGHLTSEGHFDNGRKSGIWKTSHDKKMTRLQNFRADKLDGISIHYQDYSDSEFDFKNNDRNIKTKFSYLLNDTVLEVNGFYIEELKEDELVSETYYIGKEKANGELKYLSVKDGVSFTISIKYFANGKFTGERSYCHESKLLASECHLLESGLVENIEYDCFNGKLRTKDLYKPKKVFTSTTTYFSEEHFERQ
jgi:antitoxin component YwqK of YwqJK toxin-antitoxin module